jgi:hypothetical protein
MPPSPETANQALPASPEAAIPRQRDRNCPDSDDLPYMTMTVAAILLLLGSLWIF